MFRLRPAASADSSSVPSDILDALAEHLTPPQVVELGCLVGFWNMYNMIHDNLHVPMEQNLLAESGWVDR